MLEDLIREWDGEEVLVGFDEPSGTWMFVCIHSTRVVAGCANNQLAEPEDSDRLGDAGILYAPDFVINAGGVLYAWGTESLGSGPRYRRGATGGDRGHTRGDLRGERRPIASGTHAAAEDLARSRSSQEGRWSG